MEGFILHGIFYGLGVGEGVVGEPVTVADGVGVIVAVGSGVRVGGTAGVAV